MQTRSGRLCSQIEATYKQLDTAGTELECFQSLQKQEQLAAAHRISGLAEEVNRQMELEHKQQQRYGDLLAEHEIIRRLLEEHHHKMSLQVAEFEEKRALNDEGVAADQYVDQEIEEKREEMTIDEDQAVEEENAAEQEIDKEGKEMPDSVTEKRENEGGGGIGEGEEANRGQSLDLDERVSVSPGQIGGAVEPVHEESVETAGTKNEDDSAGLIKSGSQAVTVVGNDGSEGGDAEVVAED